MPYITSVEEIGYDRGVAKGRQEGRLLLILRQLTRKIGAVPAHLSEAIATLPIEQLDALGEALFDFESMEDLRVWLTEGNRSPESST